MGKYRKRLAGAAAVILLLAVIGWAVYDRRPGLPEGPWVRLELEPVTWAQAAGSLEQAAVLRSFFVTEGELRGGTPSGATLTVRWGARWTVPGEELEIAWEAAWSQPPRAGDRQITISWQGADPMGQPLGFARHSYRAAARADGIHYKLADGLETAGLYWPLPDRADAACGYIRLVPVYPSRNMERAMLTLTLSQGEQTSADQLLVP